MSDIRRLYSYGYLEPLQTQPRVQCTAPNGLGCFGLPAEQYALDTGNDPAEFTKKNIETFRRQINALGFSYDWNREINTTDPSTTSGRNGSLPSFMKKV